MMHFLARGVCIQRDTILLARHKEKDYYFLPGGHIETGESGAAALKREIEEETGLIATNIQPLTTLEHAWQGDTEIENELTLIYSHEVPEGEVRSVVEHLEFTWLPMAEFENCRFLPDALKAPILGFAHNEAMPPFISTLA